MTTHDHNAFPAFDRAHSRLISSGPDEDIWLEQWEPGDRVARATGGELRLLVLDGMFRDVDAAFGPQSWLRLPAGEPLDAQVGPGGCTVWIERAAAPRLS